MTPLRRTALFVLAASSLALLGASLATSCAERELDAAAASGTARAPHESTAAVALAAAATLDVMESAFCARCHVDQAAEHEQSTHGRAFTDEEVRLGTARFAHQDCIICHTPRPIFETGIGMNPKRRFHGLEEGNTCMTCHFRPDYDYSKFQGGAECKGAFHPDVGTVEACASCHRNHGTPYQWEKSPLGKAAGNECVDCHMQEVQRPIALGGPAVTTRSHVFPGSRDVAHVDKAYEYDAEIEGDHVVVTIRNKGAAHNFPTELKQRSVESLVVVRDAAGNEVARSRMVFRDPYKRPYGLELPVNTQIPSGETRSHRVPIGVGAGTVETTLYFKLYYPIDDHHPDMSRVLTARTLPFAGVTPSSDPVDGDPEVVARSPENIDPEIAGIANLVDYSRPPIGTTTVEIPSGDAPADIAKLIELFQFPVPEANAKARAALARIGAPALPALVDALGSWDNKTFNQSMQVLEQIGEPARAVLLAATADPRLYVRLHAREALARLDWEEPEIDAAVARGLELPGALDRASAARAIGHLHFGGHEPALRRLLADPDPDVVREAALALGHLGDREAIAPLQAALARAHFAETRFDLAKALAWLGDPSGAQTLLGGLDHRDDLIREACFEAFFEVTGQYLGYEPLAPRPERLDGIARLQRWWSTQGGASALLEPDERRDRRAEAQAWRLINDLGGNDLAASTPEKDTALEQQILELGTQAVPSLVKALKYPPGFADKRSAVIRLLARTGDKRAAPALCYALRDPVVSVAAWAAFALEALKDPEALPALVRYEQRIRRLAAQNALPATAGTADQLLLQVSRTRLALEDERARETLVALLLSDDAAVREGAIAALGRFYGDDKGYDPNAAPEARLAAAAKWQAER
jgi:HEAT repeat protein